MWPFKKKSQADKAIDVMDVAIAEVAAKYEFFSDQLPFNYGLIDVRLASFVPPMIDGLRANYPELRASPDEVLQLYATIGIVKSGRHSVEEVAKCLRMEPQMLESLIP